jgi:LacI family gluconate utilization system Gnt-I transcriptional repressor
MTQEKSKKKAQPRPGKTRASTGLRIEQVAERAGVSPITVSRVLNKPETVSDKTKAAVWKAIEEMGYVPNRLAGGLASNSSRNVGMVLPYIDNVAFTERVKGVTDVIRAHGYTLLLGLSGYSPEVELEHVVSFLGQRVAGLILTGTVHADRTYRLLERAGVPVVEVPVIGGRLIDMAVGYSNEEAAYSMVTHLARCGYRKVGLISTPTANDRLVQDRRSGYLRAVAKHRMARDPSLMIETHVGIVNGEKAFVELLSRHPDMDAVFCTADILAIGCMLEARRRGIDVPGDIGVAGYDDIELAQEFLPPLTTVRLQRYKIGATAAQMMLQRLQGEQPAKRAVDLGFEIVVRGSTRKPR